MNEIKLCTFHALTDKVWVEGTKAVPGQDGVPILVWYNQHQEATLLRLPASRTQLL